MRRKAQLIVHVPNKVAITDRAYQKRQTRKQIGVRLIIKDCVKAKRLAKLRVETTNSEGQSWGRTWDVAVHRTGNCFGQSRFFSFAAMVGICEQAVTTGQFECNLRMFGYHRIKIISYIINATDKKITIS
eukprot:7736702-Karenia_brevis.AAC.1